MSEETKNIEVELLESRLDDMTIAMETARSHHENTIQELTKYIEELEKRNRELSAQVDRLRLHLQQGVEL